MKIQKILEKNGFEVEKTAEGWEISQSTLAGEDWRLYLDNLEDIATYAENFDEEEEFTMWVEAKKVVCAVSRLSLNYGKTSCGRKNFF